MILVTGGTTGIGLATARQLADAGHEVMIAGRNRDTGEEAIQGQTRLRFHQADLSRVEGCRSLMAAAFEACSGRLAGLVNNAGIGARHDFAQTTPENWDSIMAANARSVFLMTQLALPALTEARGSVVNVASVAGLRGEENLAIYAASKAAVIGLTQSLALELGGSVRFNAACAGQVATRMMATALPAFQHDHDFIS